MRKLHPSLSRTNRTRTLLHWTGVGAIALAGALIAVYAAAGLGGISVGMGMLGHVYDAVVLLAVGACALRAITTPRDRLPWSLFTAGLALNAAGFIYYETFLLEAASVSVPSPADGGWLGCYVALYAGVMLLHRRRTRGMGRSQWLDGVIAGLAAAAVSAAIVLDDVLASGAGTSTAKALTILAYPVADLVLLALIVGGAALTGWRLGRDLAVLALGLLALAITDGFYLVRAADGTYAPGGILDAGWLLACLLIAAAAYLPARAAGAASVRRGRVLVLPSLAGLIGLVILTWDHFERLNTVALALASASVAAVVARMAMSFAENHRMLDHSELEARTDALTGLGNRRSLLDDLTELLDPERGRPVVLALFDLNGFKHYNDSFGHPAGDALLARLGNRLAAAAAQAGAAYRLGGDEFCVLVQLEHGHAVLARAKHALSEHGEGFEIGASCGSVELPFEAAAPADALRRADQRMYAEKRSRRIPAERQTGDVLLRAFVERNPELAEHLTDVAASAERVGQVLGLVGEEQAELRLAAELHDVGKMAIPEAILDKPGPLDDAEWTFIRTHTIIGERILGAAPALTRVAAIVRSSHERWDGAGYPDRLVGGEIPLAARVIAVCDAYHAMHAGRPYARALSHTDAIEELRRCSGTQFDPGVVAAFERSVATVLQARAA